MEGELTDATKDQLKELARGVVLAQGNVFIKELLRSKSLPIGATKADFTQNMLEAIDSGALTETDFEAWLHRVEGWGDQHIYLYEWSPGSDADSWSDAESVRDRVRSQGMLDLWETSTSLVFPEELSLTGIYFRDGQLQVVWHRGTRSWVRDPSRDYDEIIEDDHYEFRAYRERSERSVMRFALRVSDKVGGAFIQIPLSSDEHGPAHAEMMGVVDRLLGAGTLSLVDVPGVIRRLDDAQLQGDDGFSTQVARWSGPGAYVEFGADSGSGRYQDVESIREVRLALPTSVTGTTARMRFEAPGDEGPGREIKVNLYGSDRRLWIASQMTEGQAWALIDQIRSI